ncbi:MAG TPA: hypothetical protein DCQ31_05585, partial [Bacteroidales bacterium]|nr:hypothetical protein [Bacteroidales bacterium]
VMKKNLLLLCYILFIPLSAFSQIRIQGLVIDAQTKDGLPGATITVKGSSFGTITDAAGKF